jgi:hypothetical protein
MYVIQTKIKSCHKRKETISVFERVNYGGNLHIFDKDQK